MAVRTPDSGFENLERRYESVARLVPYLLLVVPFIPYVLSQAPSAGAIGITVGVAVAAGAWVAWMVVLHPGPPRAPVAGVRLLRRAAGVHRRAHLPQPVVRVLHLDRLPARRAVSGRRVAVGRLRGRGVLHRAWPSRGDSTGRPCALVVIWVLLAGVDVVLIGVFTMLGVKAGEQNQARKQHDRRTRRGEPPARADDRREHRAAGSVAHPGQGGGRGRRAAADGPGDPRHHRPGPDRDRHSARGGPADQQRRRTRAADRQRQTACPAQPGRGPPLGPGAAAAGAGGQQAPRGAGRRGGPLVGHQRRDREMSRPPGEARRCTRRSR